MTYPNSQYVDPTVPHPAECDGCGRTVRDNDTLDGNRNCASCQAEQAEALEELRPHVPPSFFHVACDVTQGPR